LEHRAKILAVADQPIHLMDIAYELSKPLEERCFKKFDENLKLLESAVLNGGF